MKILVTGTTKGLGKFLARELASDCYTRTSQIEDLQKQKTPYDAIVHCAFERAGKITNHNLYSYINNSIELTKQILSIPHKKFFLCSTVDVYPKDSKKVWKEDDTITLDSFQNLYGFIKLCCESIVTEKAKNPVIMRLGAMLGRDIQPNSLMKALLNLEEKVGLSADSDFYYILHEDILAFIKQAIKSDLKGCFNLVSSNKARIGEVVKKMGSSIRFGDFTYHTSEISNAKASAVSPEFNKSSEDNVKIFFDYIK